MSPSPAPRRGGTVLEGRYRVDGVVARGGMSTVHRGMDLRLDRPVAIKVMDPALARDPAFVRRFEREARAAARLAHPGIVSVHDQGRDTDGTIFLVLELVEGGTLRDVLREHGRLRPATALTVVEQVVTALRVAHSRGLVHRDVKPENVLISTEGAVKVADFGLVGAAWGGSDGTLDTGGDGSDELILGTVAYLSPEQVADGHADERSDLYSAGIVLFELLTGAPPYGGDSALSVAYRHVEADVPPPSSRVAGIPRALDRLVLAATRRDPDRRPADAAAFLTAARDARVVADLPFSPVPPPTRTDAIPPPPRPLQGTRVVGRDDLDDLDPDGSDDAGDDAWIDEWDDHVPASRRAGRDDGGDDDPEPGWDDEDDEDDEEPPARRGPRTGATVDDVDDRMERLERARARRRSRRVFAAWVVGVGAATVAAGVVGWGLAVP